MSQQTVQFQFQDTTIRAVEREHELWFVAKDIAQVLGYSDPAVAVSKILTRNLEEFKGCQDIASILTPGGEQEVTILSEFGLYSFAMLARTDAAIDFRKFVRTIISEWRKSKLNGIPVSVTTSSPMVAESIEDALIMAIEQIKKLRQNQEAMAEQIRELGQLRLVVNNPRINARQEAMIRAAVSDRMKWLRKNAYHTTFQKLYGAFNRRFEIPRYSELPEPRLDEAIEFIQNWRPAGSPVQKQAEMFK